MSDFPERDWKLLRELKPVALERLCEKILRDAAEIAKATGSSKHQSYLKLWGMIQDQNEVVAQAFDDHRRSTALLKILEIHRQGLLTDEEFARFSEETQKRVLTLESL